MIGTTLNNTYRLEQALTEGGMGQVYIGSHLRIKSRKYAIKRLRPELAATPNFQTRFQMEAEVMMALNHPHIVRIEDFLIEDNAFYLVMEFIEGSSLDARLRLGAMGPDLVHRLAVELLSGLEMMHRKGIIHRDLKPSNLLLTTDDVLKITDFGISLQEQSDRRLTRTGTILGTPDYMSPEQIMSYSLDGRSDLYSAGVILYEMVRGIPPFPRSADTGGSYQILFAHVHRPPPALDELVAPAYLRIAIERCIRKDPRQRFASAAEMIRFLEESRANEGFSPVPSPLNVLHSQSATTYAGDLGLPSQDQLIQAGPLTPDRETALLSEQQLARRQQEEALNQHDTEQERPATRGGRAWMWLSFLLFVAAGLGGWWVLAPEHFAHTYQQTLAWVDHMIDPPVPASHHQPDASAGSGPVRVSGAPRRGPIRAPLNPDTAAPPEQRSKRPRALPDRHQQRVPTLAPDQRALAPSIPDQRAVAPSTPERKAAPVVPDQGRASTSPPDQKTVPLKPTLPDTGAPDTGAAVAAPDAGAPDAGGAAVAAPDTRILAKSRPAPRTPMLGLPWAPSFPIRTRPSRRPPKREPHRARPAPRRPHLPRATPRSPRRVASVRVAPRPMLRVLPKRPLVPRPVSKRPVQRVTPRALPVRRPSLRPALRAPLQPRSRPPQTRPLHPPERPVRSLPTQPRHTPPAMPRRVAPRRVLPKRPAPRRVIPREHLPDDGGVFQWPLPVSGRCAKLLQICEQSCTKKRIIVTLTFRNTCRLACWKTRIIQFKGLKICPPDRKTIPL